MIRNFGRHLRQSLTNLRRQGWLSFIAISTVAVTLTLVGVIVAILFNLNKIMDDVQSNLTINVYLNTDVYDDNPQNADGTTNEQYHVIYDQIKSIDGVKSLEFSTKEQEYDKLKKAYGSVWEFDQGNNPLYSAYIVKVDSLDKMSGITKQIKQIQGVNDAKYIDLDIDGLAKRISTIRLYGLIGIGVFVLIAIFLISNTIRITIMSRRDDIIIMRLVGAKNSYIRAPFFLEGAWIGLLGSILPGLILYFGYITIQQGYAAKLQADNLSLYPVNPYLYYLIGGLAAIGIIIGAMGSMISIRRYLKA